MTTYTVFTSERAILEVLDLEKKIKSKKKKRLKQKIIVAIPFKKSKLTPKY